MNCLYFLIYKVFFLFCKFFLLLSFFVFGLAAVSDEEQMRLHQTQYPGVVRIIIPGIAKGTGFFITPDAIVTDFHVVEDIKESIDYSGFFFANKTIGFVSRADITIRNMDVFYDLAVLKVKDYRSESFYPIDSSFNFERDIKASKGFTVVGFPGGRFHVEQGHFAENHSFGNNSFIRMNNRNSKHLSGMSGSPVFSNGKLVGIVKIADNYSLVFTSVNKLRELLLKPDLSCSSAQCIREEKDRLVLRAKAGDHTAQLIMGSQAATKGQYDQAVDWYRKAALQDLYIAQYYLAQLLSRIEVGYREFVTALLEKKDLSAHMAEEERKIRREAVYWSEKAATEGKLADAQLFFGLFFEKGILDILPQDWEKAFYWYKKAMAQGHPGAIKKIEKMSKNKDVPLPLRKVAYRTFIEVSRSQRLSAQSAIRGFEVERGNMRSCFLAF